MLDRNGVARNAGFGSSEQPLLADQTVDKRRLARVGAAYNSDTDWVSCIRFGFGLRLRDFFRQRGTQGIIKIGHALTMLGRNRYGLAKSERIGFQPTGFARCSFALVGDEYNRFAGFSRSVGKGVICRQWSGPRVNHEKNNVGLIDGGFGLLPHPTR